MKGTCTWGTTKSLVWLKRTEFRKKGLDHVNPLGKTSYYLELSRQICRLSVHALFNLVHSTPTQLTSNLLLTL